ncbi:MAG TPA: hypothetical protein VKK61_04430 [Tepidisphaeraceae bacterium]|nr:hypothetical protein [Tepidisphaeraceae bacterium]
MADERRAKSPRARPVAPPAKPQAAEAFHVETDETDIVNMPTASGRRKAKPRAAAHGSLFLQRTMVPILLTSGVGLPALGILWFKTDPDSPFRLMGKGLPMGLIGVGSAFLVIGILNALSLRKVLQTRRAEARLAKS